MKIDDNRITQQTLEGEEIHIGVGGVRAVISCELKGCVLTIEDKYPGIYFSKLVDCRVSFKRPLRSMPFFGNRHERSVFEGEFVGVDFGRDPWLDPVSKTYDELGELIDCDFTQSKLDLCRFFTVNILGQRFAPWPQFVVPFERELAASKLDRIWPGSFGRFLRLAQSEDLALSATTGTVDYFVRNRKKNRGYNLTEEELRCALLDVGGVLM